jgi:hypothetical protein
VSVFTTSVSGILSTLSAGLLTTIVSTRSSDRGPKPIFGPQAILAPKPIFGTGRAHLDLVGAHATTSASPRDRRSSDVSGYRTDLPASFHALLPAPLHKAYHLV